MRKVIAALVLMSLAAPAFGQSSGSRAAACVLGQYVDGCRQLDGKIWHAGEGSTSAGAS
jgi:hypothetical protein